MAGGDGGLHVPKGRKRVYWIIRLELKPLMVKQ